MVESVARGATETSSQALGVALLVSTPTLKGLIDPATIVLAGCGADAPTADPIDLDALARGGGDWLIDRLRAVPA